MLDAGEDVTYIYVFIGVMLALALVIFTVADNSVVVREVPERIVSETAYVSLILAAA
jgi:hypothetical protein